MGNHGYRTPGENGRGTPSDRSPACRSPSACFPADQARQNNSGSSTQLLRSVPAIPSRLQLRVAYKSRLVFAVLMRRLAVRA